MCDIFFCFHHHMLLFSVPTCFVFSLLLLQFILEVFSSLNIVSEDKQFDLQTSFTLEILIQFPFHCFWIWWEIFQNCCAFFFNLHRIAASQLAICEPAPSRTFCAGILGLQPGWRCLDWPLVLEPPPSVFSWVSITTGLVEQTTAADLPPYSGIKS